MGLPGTSETLECRIQAGRLDGGLVARDPPAERRVPCFTDSKRILGGNRLSP